MKRFQENFAGSILEEMPDGKKAVLEKALKRNFYLTSAWIMEFGKIRVYKEGWYLQLFGTRSSFSVWAFDNDGEFIYGRKPHESKLHFLYEASLHFSESDFDKF